MTVITIKTKGMVPLQARCADQGGYVTIRTALSAGDHSLAPTLGWQQICEGGGFTGSTLTATPETLRAVVRRWARQYIAHRDR